MTKEEWAKIRDSPEIELEVFFDFYREKGGILSDIKEFAKIFFQLTSQEAWTGGPTGMKKITTASAIRNLKEHYDAKFSE